MFSREYSDDEREPDFYKNSAFFGSVCPHQNKEFVCRGHDYERLEAFQQRMLGEFPQAIAMQHPNQPDEAILQCDAQCILQQRRSICVCVCVCVLMFLH